MPAFLLPFAAAAASAAAPAASLTPSLIAGGASLAGSIINAGSQLGTNSSQLSYAREMYDKQRADALADWDRQNLYNSPKEQMARFKEAGLNPNLIYGQMSNSPVVRSSSPQSYNPTAPQVDLGSAAGSALGAYYDSQLKNATIDNVKAQADTQRQIAILKGMDILKESKYLPQYEGMANANVNKLYNDAAAKQYEVDNLLPLQKEKLELTNAYQRSMNRIPDETVIKIRQEVQNLKSANDIQELEKKLKQWQVDNVDINNIMNYATKFLGLIPGIGGLFK